MPVTAAINYKPLRLQHHASSDIIMAADIITLMLQISAEAEQRAAEEAARLEAERIKAEATAARYERKQKAIQEKLARKAEESERIHEAKEALRVKLRAMEGKLLKGEARGGLLEVTRKKEAEIAKREQELERR